MMNWIFRNIVGRLFQDQLVNFLSEYDEYTINLALEKALKDYQKKSADDKKVKKVVKKVKNVK